MKVRVQRVRRVKKAKQAQGSALPTAKVRVSVCLPSGASTVRIL